MVVEFHVGFILLEKLRPQLLMREILEERRKKVWRRGSESNRRIKVLQTYTVDPQPS